VSHGRKRCGLIELAVGQLKEQRLLIVLGMLIGGATLAAEPGDKIIPRAYRNAPIVWIAVVLFVCLVAVTWNQYSLFSWLGGFLLVTLIPYVLPVAVGWVAILPVVLTARLVISQWKKSA
jgi:hypothetical protein